MVRFGPGWSGPGRSSVRSGPTRHNLRVFGKTGPDRTGQKTEIVQNPEPRPDRLSFDSVRFVSGRFGFSVRVGFGSAMLSPTEDSRRESLQFLWNFVELPRSVEMELLKSCEDKSFENPGFIEDTRSSVSWLMIGNTY
nr:hypothetical protein [Tanacetum cinerariifolium]